MSFDIDNNSNTGELEVPVAAEQILQNTFTQEAYEEFPIPELLRETMEAQARKEPVQEVSQEPSPQELNFKALREEIESLKSRQEAEKRELQMQLDIYKANSNQAQQTQEHPKKMFDGLQDNDYPTVAEMRQEWERKESAYQAQLEEMQVRQMHPDYAEVIEKFAVPLVKQKPHLAEGIHGARNKALFAYELGKMAQQMQMAQEAPPRAEVPQQTAPSVQAQRIVENSRRPGTLSQAGGQSTLNKADYYASMSDAEFAKLASRHLESI